MMRIQSVIISALSACAMLISPFPAQALPTDATSLATSPIPPICKSNDTVCAAKSDRLLDDYLADNPSLAEILSTLGYGRYSEGRFDYFPGMENHRCYALCVVRAEHNGRVCTKAVTESENEVANDPDATILPWNDSEIEGVCAGITRSSLVKCLPGCEPSE